MDMTLIPDFGQVQSDARVLNLTPYEVKYDENRQFFTEGTELFGKAALSQQYFSGNNDIIGYKYDITAGKVGGIWQYTYNRLVLSDSYDPNDLDVNNINYNAFTVDMLLTWHFAPGSQLTFAWKNNIDSNIARITRSYADNLRNTLEQPQVNSFSIRLLYYLDYQSLMNLLS